MTIRKFCEIYKNENGDVEAIINHFINDFMDPSSVEVFENLWEKLEDAIFFISEDADGDLYVAGNEYFCMTYFNDDVPMSQVYSSLIDSMKKEITKIENKIEKEIEESKYKVLDAFACESDFNVDYSEWWDYVMGKTPDWVEDKYYEKFCDVLYGYFVEYAKEYNYGVEKIDGGISLEKSDFNMDKWVVIAKCSDGDVVISKNGENAFDIDIADEIAEDHQDMGPEIEIMQYTKYKEIYE